MPGFMSDSFRHRCPPCYLQSLGDWTNLLTSLKELRGIRPTDIDAMIEVNRHFMFLEHKGVNGSPNDAQRRALMRLSELPRVTVCLVRDTGDAGKVEILRYVDGKGSGWSMSTVQEAAAWLLAWACAADAQ